MPDPGFDFLLGDNDIGRVLEALGGSYTVVRSAPSRSTRIWLDTFDGRLQSAGLTLAFLPGAHPAARHGTGDGELVVTGAANGRQPALVRWPALLAALPPGPVVDRLGPVVGVRALLPVVTVRSSRTEWRICDRDQKTVVHAVVDRPTVTGSDVTVPARLSLTALRGYDAQARRVAAILASIDGLDPDPPAELDLLRAAGVCPPLRRAGALAPVRADQPAARAVAGLLLGLLAIGEDNVPGVVDDVDTEFLHDLRVSVRRTRSTLKLAGDVLPGDLADRFAPEFKWLGDLTTPMRDLDTLLLGFDAMAALLTGADPADLEPLRAHLHRQRAVARRRLRAGLRSARFVDLTAEWRAALTPIAQPADRHEGERAAVDTATLARQRIDRAWRRVARRAAGAGVDSPPPVLHDLRKRCKELRYVLELFAGVCRPRRYRAILRDLKALQDHLGEFQDAEVHRTAVRAYAEAMLEAGAAPAAALLAMGELVVRFGEQQQAAAAEAVARVGQLATERNRRRVAGLVRAT